MRGKGQYIISFPNSTNSINIQCLSKISICLVRLHNTTFQNNLSLYIMLSVNLEIYVVAQIDMD